MEPAESREDFATPGVSPTQSIVNIAAEASPKTTTDFQASVTYASPALLDPTSSIQIVQPTDKETKEKETGASNEQEDESLSTTLPPLAPYKQQLQRRLSVTRVGKSGGEDDLPQDIPPYPSPPKTVGAFFYNIMLLPFIQGLAQGLGTAAALWLLGRFNFTWARATPALKPA